MKLKKLSETHYIAVDDSEINEGDWLFDKEFGISQARWNTYEPEPKTQWKITHSFGVELEEVENRPLLEVEELTLGYSVEKMAEEKYPYEVGYCVSDANTRISELQDSFVEGFNAHKELVKDKFFTIEEVKNAFEAGFEYHRFGQSDFKLNKNQFIQSLLPKTEWDIEIVNDKIKLI